MSGDLRIPLQGGELIRQHPELMREEQTKAQAIIEVAAKLRDWALLEDAIDAKIEQQIEFCGWWHGSVRRAGQGNNSEPRYFVEQAEHLTGINQQQVSRWRSTLGISDEHSCGIPALVERYHRQIRTAAYRKAGLQPAENHRAEGTGVDEWFTPSQYIEAVRVVLGEIDLDPASHATAQEWIKAARFYTTADNGLSQEWHGRVWLNPPYSRELIGAFITKLIGEIDAGRVESAIALTHNYTDTDWFHRAAGASNAICFTRGRVRFVDDLGRPCAPTQGQAFFYYGLQPRSFEETFKVFGLTLFP